MRSRIAALALFAAAGCAVGPSTRVDPTVPSVAVRTTQNTTARTRALFDSLRAARAAETPDSTARITSRITPRTAPASLTAAWGSAESLAWLSVLRDTTLQGLVRTAIDNNRTLQLAEARIDEYRALRGVAASRLYPQLSVSTSAASNRIALAASPPIEFDAVRATTDLAWELDFWGRTRRAAEAARFDLTGREEDARAVALTLIGDVAGAYLQLREADAIIEIAERTLESRGNTLQLARRRFEQGVISELDVRQFEATLADPAARVADYARQRTEGENLLSLLSGSAPAPVTRGQLLGDIVKTVEIPDTIPGALLARRPDVLRAQRDYQAAIARIGVAQAARLPTIVLGAQYGAQRPSYNGLFDRSGEIYAFQAGISLPIFTGGRLSAETRAARARAEEFRSAYEQTVLVALRETSDAAAGVRLRRDQLVAQETQERALQAAFAIAERRYAAGVSSYLEVLDAQRALFAAQIARVQTERQYLTATVQLFRALGGTWARE